MRKLLAIALICAAAGAHAQSYEQRAEAERVAQVLADLDKQRMDEARRAAARPDNVSANASASKSGISGWVWGGVIFFFVTGVLGVVAKQKR